MTIQDIKDNTGLGTYRTMKDFEGLYRAIQENCDSKVFSGCHLFWQDLVWLQILVPRFVHGGFFYDKVCS